VTKWQYKDEEGKVCTLCGTYRTWDQYHRNAAKPTGRRSECRDCKNRQARKRYQDKKGSTK
jgi:hypothetical protein